MAQPAGTHIAIAESPDQAKHLQTSSRAVKSLPSKDRDIQVPLDFLELLQKERIDYDHY